jgi:hypothetical protein
MPLYVIKWARQDYNNALSELTKYIEYTNDPPARRKEVLNLLEWLKTAVKAPAQATTPNVQPQQPVQTTPPAPSPQPARNNTGTGTPQMQEVPLQ